ncbi:ABC transporter permease [Halococcus thailandensis]|uniref:ABC transporter permease n=1 Tax=Halococcus thailandensis JCM 13552 TaxID=1227457 RepID=M0N1X8_9EURY|nr:ABC transporter permease [Halococcus thailandensis]EMA51881.1 ABC transporter permease [Halococcus thailandensis JCM 13552]
MAVSERISTIDVGQWARRIISVAAVFVLWALATNLLGLVPNLPSPLDVGATLVESLVESSFWTATVVSTARIYVSFVIAVALAVPLGLGIGWSRVFADFTFPALETLRPVPPVAWIPVVSLVFPIFSFGIIGYPIDTGILFITFLGAFFPILLNAVQGVQSINEEYPRAAESLGSSPFQTFRHVIYPGALPSIHAGMINGMGLAWVNLVAAEMIAGTGLGYLTWSSYIAGDYATIVVGMLSIGLLGYGSSLLIRWFGTRRLPWIDADAI